MKRPFYHWMDLGGTSQIRVGKCSSKAKEQDSHVWLRARGCACRDPAHSWVQGYWLLFQHWMNRTLTMVLRRYLGQPPWFPVESLSSTNPMMVVLFYGYEEKNRQELQTRPGILPLTNGIGCRVHACRVHQSTCSARFHS